MQDAMITMQAQLANQRRFFTTGETLSYDYRRTQLEKLYVLLQMHEADVVESLGADLKKSRMESIATEYLLVMEEINYVLKNLKKWMRPQKVRTPFPALFPGSSKIHAEPYGTALIIAPWNYPFLLSLSPLIGAISAGNCAIIKPSEYASQTQHLISSIINHNFPAHYLLAITGGPEITQALLAEKMDYIFFTGSTNIGKLVMKAAAKHLTPVTLELGGKSPCIVDASANIDFAARRIAWAKHINAGQTCIAPDFLYVHTQCKQAFVTAYQAALKQFYGDDPSKSESYSRIINQKHMDRLTQLMQKGDILLGGTVDEKERYIAPTLIDHIRWEDPIMQTEIFGPLLPVLTFDDIDEVITTLRPQPKPLALYLFSKDSQVENKILQQLSFGGGCVNDCIVHMINPHLPFGGVGASGMGHYHGYYSFQTFSHQKSIYKKWLPLDFKLEYPPYTDHKLKWLRKLFRL